MHGGQNHSAAPPFLCRLISPTRGTYLSQSDVRDVSILMLPFSPFTGFCCTRQSILGKRVLCAAATLSLLHFLALCRFVSFFVLLWCSSAFLEPFTVTRNHEGEMMESCRSKDDRAWVTVHTLPTDGRLVVASGVAMGNESIFPGKQGATPMPGSLGMGISLTSLRSTFLLASTIVSMEQGELNKEKRRQEYFVRSSSECTKTSQDGIREA